MAHYYNLRSSKKTFKKGDQVIVLIPDSTNKLYARWQGPATIKEEKNPHSFLVSMPDGSVKHIHQNKIREYIVQAKAVNVILEGEEEFGGVESFPITDNKETEFQKLVKLICIPGLSFSQNNQVKSLILEHEPLFNSPFQPAKVGEHRIELLSNITRKKPHCYKVPMAYREEVDKQVQELLDLNLIETSEAEITYPIVCVAKKDATMCMCVDYRALNAVTKVPIFPMKDIQEVMYIAGGAEWLTSLDLLRGYWQIKVADDSKHLTSFMTPSGVFQWKTMPFGLVGASGTFQKVMNHVLKAHSSYAQAYIDDIIIFSKSWNEHLKHLSLIFQELERLRFTIRIDKCSFATKEIKYLGHKIGSGKHGPDEEKIAAIKELKRPIDKKGVHSVLGLMGFYRSYIPNYAEIAAPLTDLTKKRAPNKVSWGKGENDAFNELKTTLCKVTYLATPDFKLPYQIHSDASNLAVGSCLTQIDDKGHYKPIAFASQKLTGAQGNWASIEKEAWAVLFGLNKFDKWIYGGQIEVITDHNPLKYLNETTPKSPKLTRWALALQRWNLKITHRPGVQHQGADAISRLARETKDAIE